MKRGISIRRLKQIDYVLVIKVYFLLCCSKWYIEKHSLKSIVRWIKRHDLQERMISSEEMHIAWKVTRYTHKLAKFVPFESKCYDKALTVKKILNQQQIPATLLMGLKDSKEKGLEAHAWISCDGKWIMGKEVAAQYTIVRTFI